jgi:hypothetical protein
MFASPKGWVGVPTDCQVAFLDTDLMAAEAHRSFNVRLNMGRHLFVFSMP